MAGQIQHTSPDSFDGWVRTISDGGVSDIGAFRQSCFDAFDSILNAESNGSSEVELREAGQADTPEYLWVEATINSSEPPTTGYFRIFVSYAGTVLEKPIKV